MKVIVVPKNSEAAGRLDLDDNVDGDLHEFKITDEDFNELWRSGLIAALNERLGLMIDEFEDETLHYEGLGMAVDIIG